MGRAAAPANRSAQAECVSISIIGISYEESDEEKKRRQEVLISDETERKAIHPAEIVMLMLCVGNEIVKSLKAKQEPKPEAATAPPGG